MRRSRLIPFCAALAFAGAALADSPRRVVTMNHCADQYALLLGAPGQVVSVSHIAVDPNLSAMVEEASRVAQNRAHLAAALSLPSSSVYREYAVP